MSIDVVGAERVICSKCGTMYGRRKGYFPVSYATLHKGIGYIPICRTCIDGMYDAYLAQCGDERKAVRQVCRKLDLFWSDNVFDIVLKKSTTKTMMTQYIARINTVSFAGKSYDDTLSAEGTLWTFGKNSADTVDSEPAANNTIPEPANQGEPESTVTMDDIPKEVADFWGPGYTPDMYLDLEARRKYWMSRFPEDFVPDIGTEALIRQICSLELDINRDRVAGRSVDKSVTALNALLGSANLKPTQKRAEENDASLADTPLGVWLYRYENKRPLPEIDEELKDVNGIKRYVFTWMGHLCKMLGIKNGYTKLYEDEIARLRVEKPEYDGEDDETMMTDVLTEDSGDSE